MLKFLVIVLLFIVFSCSNSFVFAEKLGSGNRKNEIVIDVSRSLVPVPLVFTPGMLTDYWRSMPYPFTQELSKLNKQPAWRFGYGIGGGIENREKELKTEEDWRRFDELIRRECADIKQKFPGKIILSIAQMVPKWLSKHHDKEKSFGDAKWAVPWKFSPPGNYEKWAAIIKRVVSIHQSCGLNADYIILDEPDWMFYGTEEEAFETYKHAAFAIKKVNPNIKIGALGVSNWSAKKGNIPGAAHMDIFPHDHTMIKGFIDYIGKNPDVPVDFIDWHFSHANSIAEQVKQTKEWIDAAWPKDKKNNVFFTIGEGVYSPKKDYEAREKGASFFIMNHIAYADAGVRRYISTSLVDQVGTWTSGDWSFVGFFSDQTRRQEGVIRPKWNAFKLLTKLDGEAISVKISEPLKGSIYTASAKQNNKISVLIANHPSSPGRDIMSCLKEKGHDKEDLDSSIKKRAKHFTAKINELMEEEEWDAISEQFSLLPESKHLDGQIKKDLQSCIEKEKDTMLRFKEPISFILKLPNVPQGKYIVKRYLIDKGHSNSYRFNQQNNGIIDKEVEAALAVAEKKREAAVENHLRKNNYSAKDINAIKQQAEEMFSDIKSQKNMRTAKETLTYFIEKEYKNWDRYKNKSSIDEIRQELSLAVKEGQNIYMKALQKDLYPKIDAINNMKGVALETVSERNISIAEKVEYKEDIRMLPYSVMMLELQKVSN